MSESSHYDTLIQKLDQFIRKYYINRLLKGSLLFIAVCIGLFLLYGLIEHQFYLSKGGRKLLFFSYIATALVTLGFWVILPLSKYLKLGKVISHEQAAVILGDHFGDVKDKLLNVLQLKKSIANEQIDLIEASIHQKSKEVSIVPFKSAIDLGKNKKYLKYALPPALLLLFVLFAAPSLIRDSTYRIINNNQEFVKQAPFDIIIQNKNLEVLEFDDFSLDVKVEGEKLPNELYVNVDNYDYRLTKIAPDQFRYLFSNVRKNTEFQLYSGKYKNSTDVLKVLPKPRLVNFDIKLDYPAYTKIKDETIFNSGDISVPEGTRVTWNFNAESTDQINFKFGDKKESLAKSGSKSFLYQNRIFKDVAYSVSLSNEFLPLGDSMSYFIRSSKDEFPQITVNTLQDSIEKNVYYFVGDASDDYGLTSLSFVYQVSNDLGQTLRSNSMPVQIAPNEQIDFDYILDISELEIQPGEKISYYFEVFDNDGVKGSKSTKSATQSFRQQSIEELKEEEQQNEEEIKEKLDDSIKEAKEIQEELKKLREKLLQKTEPDWQDKKQLERLLDRQRELQQQLEEAKNANEKNLKNQMDFMQSSPEIQQKQERLQELFEEVVNDEMKELMEQIQELMEDLGKEESLQMMEEFKMDEESLENEMERLSELYKQLEVEKEMNETIEKMDELAKELDKLAEQTQDEEKSQEDLQKEQDEINKEFEELADQMDKLMEKNDELEFPKNIPDDAPEQMDDIQDDLDDSQESLEKQDNQKASGKQKSASQKMKKMSQQMQSQMMEGGSEQMQEDIETLRQLLENLVTLSFDQEGLINSINRTTVNTPRYISLLQDQMKIKDDFKIVEDTLQALSKRQPDIEGFVLEKVTEVKHQLAQSLTQLEDRKKPEANQSQRTTMTNLNDLALMLSESMEQMQQQMAGMMSGSQMCQNPGNSPGQKDGKDGKSGNVPMDKISEGQEKMSEELKGMIDKLKSGQGGSAKEFAEAAAKQAALRKALEQMQREMQEQGQGASDQLQEIIDEMDKQEVDLVNKKLDNEMLMRQQNIMTRLLEAEKAQKEREYDDKRKSTEAEEIKKKIPPSLEKYIQERKAQLEEYKYVSPEMKPYYKKLVDEYYKKLKRA